MSAPHIKTFNNLRFTVVAVVHDYHVTYTVYDIIAWRGDAPEWPRAGSVTCCEPVDRLEDAEPYLHGDVKWDGCSNWHYDEQDRLMLHGCSRAGVLRFGEIMAACWDWTSELCPNWLE